MIDLFSDGNIDKGAVGRSGEGTIKEESFAYRFPSRRTRYFEELEGESEDDKFFVRHPIKIEELFLKPLFWQCLGKAEGWFQDDCKGRIHKYRTCWRCEMHNFIDHLISGKDIESFFTNLLK